MTRTVVGTFDDAEAARRGVEQLLERGFPEEELTPVRTEESGRVLVGVHASKSGVEDARRALLAAGALAVAVDTRVS